MRRQNTGIRDVARHLGLSVSTVSRAMNGRTDVSDATRTLVREASQALGYAPDQQGRSLRQGRTETVALMMRTDISRTAMGETFFLGLCEGLQPVLAAHGLDLVILPCGSAAEQDQYLRRAVARHLADGFIIADIRGLDERVDFLIDRRVPFVTLGRTLSGGDHAWLDLDVGAVAEEAVARFVSLGHRHIVLGTVRRRLNQVSIFGNAFRAAMRSHGLPLDPSSIIAVPDTLGGGRELGDALLALPKRPTAILLLQETMAIALYQRLEEAGLRPGADLSIIGFRENQVVEHLKPRLTCFRVSLRDYGARLGAMIVDRIRAASGSASPGMQELWKMTLSPGESDRLPQDAEREQPASRNDS